MRSTTEVLEEEKETLAVEDQAQAEFSPIHIVGSEKTVNIADWLLKLSTILLKNQNSNSTNRVVQTITLFVCLDRQINL
jgi:hypothetical protein